MPQDSLTLEFQKQLKAMRKTSGITDVTPMPPTSLTQRPTSLRQGAGRRLSDIAGAQQQPDWMMQPDESGNLLTAIGKGAWTAFETATFGVPRLLLPEEWKEALEPKSFVERMGAGIGGAAGFLFPMRGAATYNQTLARVPIGFFFLGASSSPSSSRTLFLRLRSSPRRSVTHLVGIGS